MIEKSASVHWEGRGKSSGGQVSTETCTTERHHCGFASRFEGVRQSTKRAEKALSAVAGISLQATLDMAAA